MMVRNQDKNLSLSKGLWCLNSHITKESELRLGPEKFYSFTYAIKRIFGEDVCENRER